MYILHLIFKSLNRALKKLPSSPFTSDCWLTEPKYPYFSPLHLKCQLNDSEEKKVKVYKNKDNGKEK